MPVMLSSKRVPIGVQIVGNTFDDLAAFRVAAGLSKVIPQMFTGDRAGYDAVKPCDSATNGFKTKNQVIKDRTRENKKMVGADFFDRKPSLPSKIRGLPQDAHGLLLFGNHLRKGRKIRQRTILRRTVRSDFSETNRKWCNFSTGIAT